VGDPDERDDVAGRTGDLVQRCRCRSQEARAQEQVLGWVAGDGELGQQDEVGPCGLPLVDCLQDARAIAIEVADGGVDLGEGDP
jgi:hypothetical protein